MCGAFLAPSGERSTPVGKLVFAPPAAATPHGHRAFAACDPPSRGQRGAGGASLLVLTGWLVRLLSIRSVNAQLELLTHQEMSLRLAVCIDAPVAPSSGQKSGTNTLGVNQGFEIEGMKSSERFARANEKWIRNTRPPAASNRQKP